MMTIRIILVCLGLGIGALDITSAIGQNLSTPADTIATRIESIENSIQLQIDALNQEFEIAAPENRPALQERIVELKRQSEIQRLTVLLEAAQASQDLPRIEEIQRALEQWRNPPETRELPLLDTEKTATSVEPVKSEAQSAQKPVENK